MQYEFLRDCGPDDWSPLPRLFKAGERIAYQSDHYGLRGDDRRLMGVETVLCTEDGIHGFTCPEAFVRIVRDQ